MRNCPKCNVYIENDKARFCRKCGAKLPVITLQDSRLPQTDKIELSYDEATNPSAENTPSNTSTNNLLQDNANKSNTILFAYRTCIKKYKTFNGRANRCEYWYFILFNLLIESFLYLIGFVSQNADLGIILISTILLYMIAMIIPSFSVAVRRLHDSGKSGWFMLLCLIPVIGALLFLVLLCLPSNKTKNKYGYPQ